MTWKKHEVLCLLFYCSNFHHTDYLISSKRNEWGRRCFHTGNSVTNKHHCLTLILNLMLHLMWPQGVSAVQQKLLRFGREQVLQLIMKMHERLLSTQFIFSLTWKSCPQTLPLDLIFSLCFSLLFIHLLLADLGLQSCSSWRHHRELKCITAGTQRS